MDMSRPERQGMELNRQCRCKNKRSCRSTLHSACRAEPINDGVKYLRTPSEPSEEVHGARAPGTKQLFKINTCRID